MQNPPRCSSLYTHTNNHCKTTEIPELVQAISLQRLYKSSVFYCYLTQHHILFLILARHRSPFNSEFKSPFSFALFDNLRSREHCNYCDPENHEIGSRQSADYTTCNRNLYIPNHNHEICKFQYPEGTKTQAGRGRCNNTLPHKTFWINSNWESQYSSYFSKVSKSTKTHLH